MKDINAYFEVKKTKYKMTADVWISGTLTLE